MNRAERLKEDGLLRGRLAVFVLRVAVPYLLHLLALRHDLLGRIIRRILVQPVTVRKILVTKLKQTCNQFKNKTKHLRFK